MPQSRETLAGLRHAAAAETKRLHSATPRELIISAHLDLNPARETPVAQKLANMPVTARRRYLKAIKGNAPIAAILSFCWECVGWDKKEVELCTALACPLFPYRPFTEHDDE